MSGKNNRLAIIHDFLLEFKVCVTFCDYDCMTNSEHSQCFNTQHEAILEKGIFENREIYERMAK